jgi:hypothetical protein
MNTQDFFYFFIRAIKSKRFFLWIRTHNFSE